MKARRVIAHDALVAPGDFRVSTPDANGERNLWFACPAGCGDAAMIRVGPVRRKGVWLWNGSLTAPTVTPSIDVKGHWHGFLTDGMWTA